MRKIFINLFFLSLILSTIVGLIFKEGAFFRESTFLPSPPVFTTSSLMKKSFYKSLENYLDFRNPLRAAYIKSKSWLDVRLFKTVPTRQVHDGRNGWLYYRPAIRSFFKVECRQKDKALALAKDLQRLEKKLQKAGKQLVFLVAPDKVTIYPEYIRGVRAANKCEKSFYDLFLEALKTYPIDGFIRLDKALKEAKGPHLLYFREGTHWNDRAGVIAARLILKKLSTPEVSYRLPKMHFREKKALAEMSTMLTVDVYEDIPFVDPIPLENKFKFTGIEPWQWPMPTDDWVRLQTTAEAAPGSAILPAAVLYRDSFMTAPLKFLRGSFTQLYARWYHVFPAPKEISSSDVDYEKIASAKIIIIESVERSLFNLKVEPELAMKIIKNKGIYPEAP